MVCHASSSQGPPRSRSSAPTARSSSPRSIRARSPAALERLLDDEARWEQRSRAGLDYIQAHTWDRAADQVETALRRAIAVREGDG